MARYWTHLWDRHTWETTRDQMAGEHLEHTAHDDLDQVEPDDIVFVMTVQDGKLYLASGIHVAQVMPYGSARRQVGPDVKDDDWHVLGHGNTEPVDFERVVPVDIIRELRFRRDRGRVEPVEWEGPGQVNPRSIDGVTEITAESAGMLQRLLEE